MARFLCSHILLLLVVLLSLVLGAASDADPCSVASTLHDANTRTKSSLPTNGVCDIRLNSAWVRVSTGRGSDLVTSCPSPFAGCGTSFPVWLTGNIPDVSEGEVIRTACVTSLYSCCEQVLTVGVKNCGDFRVWRLPPTLACPQAYCFADPLPTMSNTSSMIPGLPPNPPPNFPEPLPPQDNNADHDSQLDKDSLEGWEPERRAKVMEIVLGVVSFLLVVSLVFNGVLLYKCCTRKRNLTYSKAQEVFKVPLETVPPYSESGPHCAPPPPYEVKVPPKVNAWVEKKELPPY